MTKFDTEIEALKEERSPLLAKSKAIQDKIGKINKKIAMLKEQKEADQLDYPMTREQQLEYFLFEDGCVSGERYKARSKFWDEQHLRASGYFPETEQVSLNLRLYKGENDNLQKTLKAVEEVLPLLKTSNGVKRLSIFEHTLSEDGCWSVEISESSFDLILHRYHHKSVEKSFDNLLELLQYVQHNHFYESSPEEE